MLDIDRDRRQSGSFTSPTITSSSSTPTTTAAATTSATATPIVVVPRPGVAAAQSSAATTPELPGGFTVADSPGSAVRGALERHFRLRRESSHDGEAGTELRSQASNATLPRSYRAPEIHE